MFHLEVYMFEERLYRKKFKGINLEFFDVCINETDLTVGANSNLSDEAYRQAKKYREQLETYINLDPCFLTSLVPVTVQPGAPEIIRRMCSAAERAGVGPMAAVAGAVSEMVGRELLAYTGEVIVENGGDIFIKTNTVRKVGIFAGNSPLSEKIAVEITPEMSPLGICTSAGTVGHSLSFGRADAAMVISKDTFLADAVATGLGNRVKTPDDIEKALEYAMGIDGVDGALVIIGDRIGALGDIRLTGV
jgi:ApbE superfamily uncharacterized protein (UPF0280 family)